MLQICVWTPKVESPELEIYILLPSLVQQRQPEEIPRSAYSQSLSCHGAQDGVFLSTVSDSASHGYLRTWNFQDLTNLSISIDLYDLP